MSADCNEKAAEDIFPIRRKEWKDLRQIASQCRSIRTNLASYGENELQDIEAEVERDRKYMAARCLKLREGLEAVIAYWQDSDSRSCVAEEMAEIAERALRV